ncbi:putative rhamnogalacturonate lyase [Dioscorea sansibarensis]
MANKSVTLVIRSTYIVLDNGIIKLTITKPGGILAEIQISGTEFSVINSSKDNVEVPFRTNNSGTRLALSVDIRCIVWSGISGFYSYAIYERELPACLGFDLVQTLN